MVAKTRALKYALRYIKLTFIRTHRRAKCINYAESIAKIYFLEETRMNRVFLIK